MTTPKDKLITHLIELIKRPTAKFSVSFGGLSLCGQVYERAELDGGATLKRTIYGNETPSSPSQQIDVNVNGAVLTIRSRDLALYWDQARDAAEKFREEECRKRCEDRDNEQAEAMLKAIGIQ